MTRSKLLTLTAAVLLTGNAFAAAITQYLKLDVTENSNVTVQQVFSLTYAFSLNGANGLDANDQGNQNTIGNPGNDVYPFSLSSNSDIITSVDARPVLGSYQRIQFGFYSKFPATIKVIASAFGNTSDVTNRPTYAWIEQISTGYIYPMMGDTVKLDIPANIDFTSDFYLHTGPAIGVDKIDETCYHSYNGSVSVENPNCSNWLINLYHNSTLLVSDSVFQSYTELHNLAAGTYTVVTSVNSISVDSTVIVVNGAAQIIPDFSIDNYNPTTDDAVNFTNASSGGISYSWDFGDGDVDTQTDATHQYLDAGNYEVVLTVMNEEGCQETTFDTVYVTLGQPDPETPVVNPILDEVGHGHITTVYISDSQTSRPFNPEIYNSDAQRIMITQTEAQPMSITILNINGQVISTTETSEEKIELNVPASGIYIVRAINTKGEATSKTIVVAN
jgi:PKD repeat protein